jgi:hypothetical protein
LSKQNPIKTPSDAKTIPEEPVALTWGIQIIHIKFDIIATKKVTTRKKKTLFLISSTERKEFKMANDRKNTNRTDMLSIRCSIPPPCTNIEVVIPHGVLGEAAKRPFNGGYKRDAKKSKVLTKNVNVNTIKMGLKSNINFLSA